MRKIYDRLYFVVLVIAMIVSATWLIGWSLLASIAEWCIEQFNKLLSLPPFKQINDWLLNLSFPGMMVFMFCLMVSSISVGIGISYINNPDETVNSLKCTVNHDCEKCD